MYSIHAQATGGFAGPGSLTRAPAGTIELTEADDGSVSLSGTFLRDDGGTLPISASVFVYVENAAQPNDFLRGQAALDSSTGAFSTVVTDIPAGSSRLFLSFVIVDPAEALDSAEAGADTVFALDVSNAACVPSLTITLEWSDDISDVDLFVTEPGGTVVSYQVDFGVSAASWAWTCPWGRSIVLRLAANWGRQIVLCIFLHPREGRVEHRSVVQCTVRTSQ